MDESYSSRLRSQDLRGTLKPLLPRAIGLILIVGAMECGAPTSPQILDPVLTCPNDIAVTGHNGQLPTVTFDTPTAIQGAPPVRVLCTPASGTQFPNGLTTVSCEATDARAHKSGCSFSVVVTPIPQLQKTTFLAFGDSITQGKTSLRARGAVKVPPGVFNTSDSYVEKLNTELTARYQDQQITIIADGFGAEFAPDGAVRLEADLPVYSPDAVLLLEGTNDMINFPDSAGIRRAAGALQRMVRYAKSRANTRVFLATLPPMVGTGFRSNPAAAAGVPSLNTQIRIIASIESVTLVDLFNAIPSNYVASDGVHLTAEGYGLMADEWQKAIIATMEVRPSTLR